MTDRWRQATLGEVIELKRGYDLPKRNRIAGSTPLVSSSGVSDYHSQAKVSGPGVVTGRYGTLGEVFFIQDDFWPLNTTLYVRDFKGNDPRFVSYLLKTINFHPYSDKAAVPGLNRNHVHNAPIEYPPDLDDQRAIAGILGSLDDKIELNRRMNETLEAMARALFKDWFVDFGPVRAKMEGRETGLPKEVTDCFPSTMDDQGWPLGWNPRPLTEVANFLNGLALQKFPAIDGQNSLPVIKIAELRTGVTDKSGRASHEVPGKYIVNDGDFLFSWSGSLIAKFWTGGEGALNQHLFKVSSEQYPDWFFSEWVHHHLHEFRAIAKSKATTMGHIQRGHLKAAMTICPPSSAIEKLGRLVSPIVERRIKTNLDNRTLGSLRDLLLPKLVSGEIRVEASAQNDSEIV